MRSPAGHLIVIKQLILPTFLLLNLFTKAQSVNYISNGSFESLHTTSISSYYNVVKYWQPIDTGQFMDYLVTLRPPIKNSPTALGYQFPRNGDNYVISQFFGFRGYPRNRLKQRLVAGKVYCSTFYIVNTNNNPYAINSFGMLFADSTLDLISNCNVPLTSFTPQVSYSLSSVFTDTLRWTAVSGTFVATGLEKYCVLGNFLSDAATTTLVINATNSLAITADICIDDVSCIELDLPAYAGRDTVIFPGDSVFLGRVPDVGINEACSWYQLPNTSTPVATIAGMYVKPVNTGTYVVRQQLMCGAVRWDTVVVYLNYVGIPESGISSEDIIINRVTGGIFDISLHSAPLGHVFREVQLMSLQGQVLRSVPIEPADNQILISATDLPPGIYLLKLQRENSSVLYLKKVLLE